MKRVRFIWININGLKLTNGKEYDVIEYNVGSKEEYSNIIILNDDNKEDRYYDLDFLFKDVTTEYRDSVIDNILK